MWNGGKAAAASAPSARAARSARRPRKAARRDCRRESMPARYTGVLMEARSAKISCQQVSLTSHCEQCADRM